MIQKIIKLLLCTILHLIPAIIHPYTITNIDNKNAIHVQQDRKILKRHRPLFTILQPGKSLQKTPDWANPDPTMHHAGLYYSGYGTSKVDFWIMEDGKKIGLNTVKIDDFRNEDGEKILLHPDTTLSVYFDPHTDNVEYQLVWKHKGVEKNRTSRGFGTMQRLEALAKQSSATPQDFPEYGFTMPSQSGLRKLITEYVGKPDPEQKMEAGKPQAPKKAVPAKLPPPQKDAPLSPLEQAMEKCVIQ